MRLMKERVFFLLIDFQEKFIPIIPDCERVMARCQHMLQIADQLNLPLVVSEQYPKGLGSTAEALKQRFHKATKIYPKDYFSCWKEPALRGAFESLKGQGRDQVVIFGIEAHVCVYQSASDLHANGFEVAVAKDAISSRTKENVEIGLGRLAQEGVPIMNMEMVMTELLQHSGTADFKGLMGLLRV